ncbi:helicase-related protein [Chryseobacterium sp. c4a]|uniref:helicase-related protein n=1 Tax=Chryseobacterium sp. c4a TaxID=1573582 RepID=UPI00135B819F|nr:helicase-related protein [Chryseobacterium sp. c4a]
MKNGLLGIGLSSLSYDQDYLIINLTEQIKHDIVRIITEVFQRGEIHVLIGTKSLLGEGWDAPKMNTLILASFVSSFVLSNQMRGRVIRTDKDTPHKTGNIWHLVCFDSKDKTGGQDLNSMKRRFKTFVGISNKETPTIENNFERLNIKTIENQEEIQEINQTFFTLAKDRQNLIVRWEKALEQGSILVEEIQVPSVNMVAMKEVKMDYIRKMSGNMMKVMVSTVLLFWQNLLMGVFKNLQAINSIRRFSLFVSLFGLAGSIVYGRKLYISSKQYWRYKDIGKQLGTLAEVVLQGLIHERVIRTSLEDLKIVSSSNNSEGAFCYLKGGSQYENTQFIQTLQELVSQIDNPRYLLKQKRKYFFLKNEQYFSVPEIFAKNKKSAKFFNTIWNKNIGESELVFTRTIDGRKILLKLRFEALLKRNGRIEHLHKWTR